jgi:hypothetical protein
MIRSIYIRFPATRSPKPMVVSVMKVKYRASITVHPSMCTRPAVGRTNRIVRPSSAESESRKSDYKLGEAA